jgi:peptidoglycan hydrolase CwlO-like protein
MPEKTDGQTQTKNKNNILLAIVPNLYNWWYYVKNGLVVLFIIAIVTLIILPLVHLRTNWEKIKCTNGYAFLAPLVGQNADETDKICKRNHITKEVTRRLEGINNELSSIQRNITDLSGQYQPLNTNYDDLQKSNAGTFDEIASKFKDDVTNSKNSLSQLLQSIFVSTQLNKGAITSYKDLQNSDIAKIIDSYNNTSSTDQTAANN